MKAEQLCVSVGKEKSLPSTRDLSQLFGFTS